MRITRPSNQHSVMLKKLIGSKLFRRSMLIWVLAVVFTELLYQGAWLQPLENYYTDSWHRYAGDRAQPRHVALVLVDDRALLERSDVPLVFWTPYYAQASRVLRQIGARAVGLDILLSVSPESWIRKLNLPDNEISRTYDTAFRTEVNSGKLVMVGILTHNVGQAHDNYLLPDASYTMAIPDFDLTAQIGLADLHADSDNTVRRFVIAPYIRESASMAAESLPRLSLPMLLALKATHQDASIKRWSLGGKQITSSAVPREIGYVGPPGTIPTVSISELLAPDAQRNPAVQSLRDKVVIIGARHNGMDDYHPTPYSTGWFGGGKPMAGIEVQANIVETLLSGKSNEAVSVAARLGYFALALLPACLMFPRLKPQWGFGAMIAISAPLILFGYFAFSQYTILPVAVLQASLLAAYIAAVGLSLTAEERARAKVTSVLGQYVSDKVVDDLVRSNMMPALGGEALQVSILFSDIRGFTSVSEKLTAGEVVEMLNEYFTRACEPILQEGGSVDKFIGDCIMAQFGSTYHYSDHALRAVRAGIRMQEIAKEFNSWLQQRFPEYGLPVFRIGVGIHSGEAIVGNIGTPQKKNFTSIGDTVNVASRLESMTKELQCGILISKETLHATDSNVITGKHEIVPVKGRQQAVEIYEVLGIMSKE